MGIFYDVYFVRDFFRPETWITLKLPSELWDGCYDHKRPNKVTVYNMECSKHEDGETLLDGITVEDAVNIYCVPREWLSGLCYIVRSSSSTYGPGTSYSKFRILVPCTEQIEHLRLQNSPFFENYRVVEQRKPEQEKKHPVKYEFPSPSIHCYGDESEGIRVFATGTTTQVDTYCKIWDLVPKSTCEIIMQHMYG